MIPRRGGSGGGPPPESYYFVGKDIIPFHTVIWPAMLMGYGGLDLPTDVPANQYITFKGEKASKSRGSAARSVGTPSGSSPTPCVLRIAAVLPEQNDTDLSDDDMIRRINDELVATWGNLVNRVLCSAIGTSRGRVPSQDRSQRPTKRWSHRSTRRWSPQRVTSRRSSYVPAFVRRWTPPLR